VADMGREVSIHVDLDSPRTLLRFYGLDAGAYTDTNLDGFYRRAMDRALALFDRCRVKATFFAVGGDLERSAGAREMIARAHALGHEIANHTYSHPFGFRGLGAAGIRDEIERCSAVIEKVIGVKPAGFRAPGYDVDTAAINALEASGLRYDSSGFWSSVKWLMEGYHRLRSRSGAPRGQMAASWGTGSPRLPHEPYFPHPDDWRKSGGARSFVEIPLPRTRMLQLPFYSNLHLLLPTRCRGVLTALVSRRYLVYLIHAIEFVDLGDRDVPAELAIHPNVRTATTQKLSGLEELITALSRRYRCTRTDHFVERILARAALA
jgi:peptidoglycan/xylan/chitin deacetylase (PgdA/CDA1 family)